MRIKGSMCLLSMSDTYFAKKLESWPVFLLHCKVTQEAQLLYMNRLYANNLCLNQLCIQGGLVNGAILSLSGVLYLPWAPEKLVKNSNFGTFCKFCLILGTLTAI